MRNDLRDLDQMVAEKENQKILTLMSKEQLEKRKEEEQENYEKNVLPQILKLTKEKDRIYFDQGKNEKYEEKEKQIKKIIEETPAPWKEMARKRKRLQELFNNIEHDLATLNYWEGKTPWILLSIRATEAVTIGFARYATTKEDKHIKKGGFKGQWIRFRHKVSNDWRTIVPEKDGSISRALFFALHKLRIACREKAQENK